MIRAPRKAVNGGGSGLATAPAGGKVRSVETSYGSKRMKQALLALVLALSTSIALAADRVPAHPHILVETTEGNFKLELDGKAAPLTVGQFVGKVDSGYYDGLIFHRVLPNFMAQAGGYTPNLDLKETEETIPNESGNGLSNVRGTIAMARTNDPHSAATQFFINVVDNSSKLDPVKDPVRGRWGYAVFGVVFEGMEVVDKIVNAKTFPNGPGGAPMPVVPVVIKKMSRITYD